MDNSILLGGRKCNYQNYCYNIERKSGEYYAVFLLIIYYYCYFEYVIYPNRMWVCYMPKKGSEINTNFVDFYILKLL